MPVADPEMPESLGPGHAGSVKPLEPLLLLGQVLQGDSWRSWRTLMIAAMEPTWLRRAAMLETAAM
jgi:hypothetical protein